MEVGCGNFHFSCCILLLGRKDERSKINTYVFFHGRKRQFVCKKKCWYTNLYFLSGCICADGRPCKNRNNELVCCIEPDAARIRLGQTTKTGNNRNVKCSGPSHCLYFFNITSQLDLHVYMYLYPFIYALDVYCDDEYSIIYI